VPVPGHPDRLLPGLLRLTAPNPGMMTGPGTNTYVIGTGDVAVVDPGPDDAGHRRAILAAAADTGGVVRWVLTTHTHPDHAPGARPLADACGAVTVGFGSRDGFVADTWPPTSTASTGCSGSTRHWSPSPPATAA
jgi:glyoxylase-like metal-dependent hydrolase (beta-lactamase superfamily II)